MDDAASPSGWRPRVTAIVPCYNAAAFISRTLDSLAAQTWPNLEILIGDDRSSDGTPGIVAAFAEEHANARVLHRRHNLGWLRNSNDLMAKAEGELMFFAFHDDIVDPTYVETLVGALNDNPSAVLAYSDVEVIEIDGSRALNSFEGLSGQGSLSRGLVMARRPPGWWVPNRGLFRTWAFHRSGGIKPNAKGEYSADWTWLLHLSLLGSFVRVPEVLCHKYYKSGSISKAWPRDRSQRKALRAAGIREAWHSELGLAQRLILVLAMATRPWRLAGRARSAASDEGVAAKDRKFRQFR